MKFKSSVLAQQTRNLLLPVLKCSVRFLDQGEAGDNVGLLLRGIDKNEIKRGMVICHPGQVKASL